MHIELPDALIEQIDAVAGPRGRSQFVRDAICRALEQHRRWQRLRTAAGSVADEGHDWDADPGSWVRRQRRGDRRRIG
jgi:hypothetical protein